MTRVMILPNITPKGKSTIHTSYSDTWRSGFLLKLLIMVSLTVLLWQILSSTPLPSDFDSASMKRMAGMDLKTSSQVRRLFDAILFSPKPSKRVTAMELSQRILDEYNDLCGREEQQDIASTIQRCREMVNSRRHRHSKEPAEQFSGSDIGTLFELDDSWDDPGSGLRLAPEAMFLIGAGILWDLIPLDMVDVPSSAVRKTTSSPKGTHPSLGRHSDRLVYKWKTAVYYLTQAREMNYYDEL